MANEITTEMLEAFSAHFKEQSTNKLIKNAVMKSGIDAVAENNDAVVSMNHVFSEEITTGAVANQKQSGRCWMFAALNTFRHKILETFHLKDFELSQNYTNFWDKFEKANFFLESVLETIEEPLDGRLASWILSTPQQDGGQWDMFVSLIQKYGVVPQQVMPETFQSEKSRRLNTLLNRKLRRDASILRGLFSEGKSQAELQKSKVDMLSEVYQILSLALGEPPEIFDFEYRDADNVFHREAGLTPQDFYKKYVGIELDDYVSMINAPTKDKPYGKPFTVQFLGNVVGGKPVKYLNVDMDTLKQLTIKQIKDKESVWFGCDVGQSSNRDYGIMDTAIFDYEETLGISLHLTKEERLDYKESMMTHAMVLTGVNLVDGKPTRWKVENSWGDQVGKKGYFVMSDEWMDAYTYQVVVKKSYLSDELQKAFDQEPIQLKPWDPMGSLAFMK